MDRTALLLSLSLLLGLNTLLQACPQNCHCHGGDLQHVICDSAGLRKIPKVSEQTRLLNLQRNNFPKLVTNSFKEMKGLVSLHLQHCKIKEISTGAFRGLKQLVYLYLSNNDINVIKQGAFSDLAALTYLYMDHNKILDLPKGLLSPLVNLFVLQLSSNKIKEIRSGTFTGAKVLRWLYLSNNDISTIQPGSLDEVENLAIFHLDNNQLSSYPVTAMSKLRVVEDLKLSHNPVKFIPDYAFQSFGRYMESLYLNNMDLERFSDKAFTGVTTLKALHIGHNRLSQLPGNFPYSKLENLTLSSNPWHCSCSLAPLRKWLDSSNARTDATCTTPSQYHRQQLRETSAFRSCKLPTKRSRKGSQN
ncbi:chondroadherin [Microcaecilia unicolor]|uniref:Chondroadherin n=1 Tax=Microcaecilia unicolor TaxID=1415580 RepID=A0A6P7YGS4_9AMPH|nr:chondroadherin [Microcaecilia unicolor]XP_030064213.1 chondroadherin [Microcaecilia unicolor]